MVREELCLGFFFVRSPGVEYTGFGLLLQAIFKF